MSHSPVLAISDLHLGDGSASDDFHADEELVQLLFTRKEMTIVLVGDIFELLQCRRAWIEAAHPEVCQAIEDFADYLIAGNHDWVAEVLCGHELIPDLILGSTLFVHGHQFDPMFRRDPDLCRIGSWLGGMAERFIHPNADYWLTMFIDWITGVGRWGDLKEYERAATDLLRKQKGLDRIILGHTHQWKVGKRYLNTGAWVGNQRDVIILSP